jgi:hypothetical protein
MNREYVIRYARAWCSRLGIDMPPISIRKMNTLGSISYHKHAKVKDRNPYITLNKKLLLWWKRDELEDTIRHELIHIASNDYGHTSVFKGYARRYDVQIREQDT